MDVNYENTQLKMIGATNKNHRKYAYPLIH